MSPDKSSVTLIIGCEPARAETLKRQINLLDDSTVLIVTPGRWPSTIRKRKCVAVFIGDQLSTADAESLVRDLREYDPQVPIRILKSRRSRE